MKKLCFLIGIFILTNLTVTAQADILKVDFKNFTYQPSCTDFEDGKDLERITVKDGEFSRDKDKDGNEDHFYFSIESVTYGDLNGDKRDEALILSNCNTGGTGQFTEGFIYTVKAGKPDLLARIPGGDRADGGLKSLTAENGLLVVVAYDASEGSGACCPEFTLTSKYRLTGPKLTAVGKGVRRELYPKQRVSFAAGTSEKTFTIKIAPEDRKRYTVGARAGQTLSVSRNNQEASVGLLGDTVTRDIVGGFIAKLPKSGDYTFEVSNSGEEIETTITVKIQ